MVHLQYLTACRVDGLRLVAIGSAVYVTVIWWWWWQWRSVGRDVSVGRAVDGVLASLVVVVAVAVGRVVSVGRAVDRVLASLSCPRQRVYHACRSLES